MTAAVAATGGGRQADALGKSQSYRPTPVDQHLLKVAQSVTEHRLVERWRRLRIQRKLSSRPRQRKCKAPIGNGHVGVNSHDGGAHFSGLETCASVHTCPVCAPKIRAARMSDVLTAFDKHSANGGGFVFMTLTVHHEPGEALAVLLDLLGGAWKSVAEHRQFKEWKQRLGLLGNIMALEVTDGRHSWHPHRHVMLFLERPPTRNEVEAFEAVLDELYGNWLAKQGRKKVKVIDPRTSKRVGVRLDYVPADDTGRAEQLGRYLTKMQAGFELARGDLKQSRVAADNEKGRLPMDIVDQYDAATDDAERRQLAARWHEYEKAMTGKSAVRFSKGLRKHLDMEDAKSDQELADEEVGGEATIYVTAKLYRRVFRDGHPATLLQVYAMDGVRAVLQCLQAWYPGRIFSEEGHLADPSVLLVDIR